MRLTGREARTSAGLIGAILGKSREDHPSSFTLHHKALTAGEGMGDESCGKRFDDEEALTSSTARSRDDLSLPQNLLRPCFPGLPRL